MPDQIQENSSNKIVVIVPAYNEEPVIKKILLEILEKGYTVIVVDDGSDISLKQLLNYLPVYFLRHQANLGQGAALQTGFDYAKKLQPDFIVTIDADGQHHSSSIDSLIEPLITNEADIVLGSRFLSKEDTTIPFAKKIVLHSARIINYFFSGLMLSDAHNGLRAFNKNALQKINITENRMAHASEFLFEIKKHRLRYKEVPVTIAYTEYSKQKGQSVWDSIRIFFDLILYKLFQ